MIPTPTENQELATYSKVQDNSALWEWSGQDRRCKLSDTASLTSEPVQREMKQ